MTQALYAHMNNKTIIKKKETLPFGSVNGQETHFATQKKPGTEGQIPLTRGT
jgi:hypothetical protein